MEVLHDSHTYSITHHRVGGTDVYDVEAQGMMLDRVTFDHNTETVSSYMFKQFGSYFDLMALDETDLANTIVGLVASMAH